MDTIDARTLVCPEPIMMVRSKVRKLSDGDELTIYTDDPRTPSDVKSYCLHMDHTFISQEEQEDDHGKYTVTKIRKGNKCL